MSQAVLRVLQKVIGTQTGLGSRGSITERFQLNMVEIFKDDFGTTPTVVEYWMES